MTIPRKQQISLADTPFYHVTSRCVRRAFLCGEDPLTQKSYEHRRQWIEDRIRLLSSLFALEICSWALLSNHYHVLFRLTPEESKSWTTEEVIERWFSSKQRLPYLFAYFSISINLARLFSLSPNSIDYMEKIRADLSPIALFSSLHQ